MSALANLRALTGPEKRLLIVSLAAVPIVSGGLAIFGFRRTRAVLSLGTQPKNVRPASDEAADARVRTVAKIVAIATGRGPVRATCLRRSLLLWSLLRREGIETVLRVGVNRDHGSLNAHAWVEYRGRPLIDADDVALRFPAFEQDFGAPTARAS